MQTRLQQVMVMAVALVALGTEVRSDGPLDFILNLFRSDGGGGGPAGIRKAIEAAFGASSAVGAQCGGAGDTECTAGSVCQATPLGNICVDERMVPCRFNTDCTNSKCFKPSGSQFGYCSGCDTDTDCFTAASKKNKCTRIASFMKYGYCVQCSKDKDCQTGYYCELGLGANYGGLNAAAAGNVSSSAAAAAGRVQAQDVSRGLAAGLIPAYTCEPRLTRGSTCTREAQCKSGVCRRRTIFFFIRSRSGTCQ